MTLIKSIENIGLSVRGAIVGVTNLRRKSRDIVISKILVICHEKDFNVLREGSRSKDIKGNISFNIC